MNHVQITPNKPISAVRFFLTLIVTILLVGAFFAATYFFDNRYTYECPQAEEGLLVLDKQTIDENGIFFLNDGWAIYQDALLTPDTIDSHTPNQYINIGEHHTMSFGDHDFPENGSVTYRMKLDVSRDRGENLYSLQLPIIYTAYRLYINGNLMLSVGNPDADNYHPQMYSTDVTFMAEDEIDIIIAASDWIYHDSGIVDAPAFGRSSKVDTLVGLRIAVQALLIGASMMLGFVIISMRKGLHKRPAILMLILIFCVIGLNLFPVVSSLRPVGIFWFYFDTFCFYAFFFFAVWLNSDLCHVHNWFAILIKIIDATLCVLSIAIPLIFSSGGHSPMHFFHEFAHYYKLFLLCYLVLTCLLSLKKSPYYAKHVLYALSVYAVVAVFNHFVPHMSNILLNDALSTACFIVVYIIGFSMVFDSVTKHRHDMVWEHDHYESVIEEDLLETAEQIIESTEAPEAAEPTAEVVEESRPAMEKLFSAADAESNKDLEPLEAKETAETSETAEL